MNDMKCPVCGKGMVFIESDEGFDVFVCTNSKCQCSGYANESVWKYIERTRKVLDVAVDALKTYSSKVGNWLYGEFQGDYDEDPGEIADNALEQITALKQKDK